MDDIFAAIEAGDAREVRHLLERDPAAVATRNPLGDTPLHEAVRYGQRETARLLLKHGADINAIGNCGSRPLHYLVVESEYDDPYLARLLIKHGAALDAKDATGWTALHWASLGAKRVARELIKSGAHVDLNIAIRLGDLKKVRRILRSGLALRELASFPETLLEDAVGAFRKDILAVLLALRRRPSPMDDALKGPLLFQAITQSMSRRDPSLVAMLLDSGLTIDVKDDSGESPIEFTRWFRPIGKELQVQHQIEEMLKAHGAV